MNFPKILLTAILLAILLAGCGFLPETGDISFKIPEVNDKGVAAFHNPSDSPLPILISIASSFNTDKEAMIYLQGDNGIYGPYSCWLKAGTTSPCNSLTVQSPGVYRLRAEVTKLDGQVVYTEIAVEWAPYSPVETFALNLAGKLGITSPQLGFNVIVGFFAAILVVVFLALKANKEGAVVFSVFVLLAIVFFAPPEISTLIVSNLFGVASGIIFIYIIKAILDRVRHVVFIKDGQRVGAYMGEGGQGGAQVVQALGKSVGDMGGQPSQLPGNYDPRFLPGDRVTLIPPRPSASGEVIDIE